MGIIRVLLVDDETLVRLALTRILADYPDLEVVGEAATGDEPVKALKRSDHRS
jgi:two-component system, NarL family, invasion response regulator UvrY